jgi:predicted Zn-dependent protease with MMP-like domain
VARRRRRIGRTRFAALVEDALRAIPEEFTRRLENVTVLVEAEPTATQIRSAGLDPRRDTLFGLYEGVALPERSHDFAGEPPDRIWLFRDPILDECRSEAEVRREIEMTIVHEIAHFFGLDEDRVRELGY